ncbi:Aminodeoxychorismate synthase component 2 [Pirellula sp. SH-Sr6A]|uniref:anthranilate synthase component II n=1 Tax=Pirellula sp. SH-Sr6A TaxID=1632865 RepID=UPI00078BDD37|nr:aminodeoxychorismate/anthranilate synthase component II [Pirellula sp. SH-Sr6A]AMV32338.1 Aminodeoxychorismate synthase component 2 [Pirellula sp. SH-Sr6A]
MILLLDNYDSFVYNLDRYLQRLGHPTLVVRSDAIYVDAIAKLSPGAIVVSPGPKTPNEAGCSLEVIRRLGPTIPILGVCLGHQAIGQAFGGTVVRALSPVHGKASRIHHGPSPLFDGIPSPYEVARYHSLVVDRPSLPPALQISAWSDEDEIMALEHRDYPIYGVQFHPESILTHFGYRLLANFLHLAGLSSHEIPGDDFGAQEC